MSIKREDLDTGRVDFADVASGKKLAPIHPGEILRDDFLEPMKISVYTLAQVIKVPRSRVNHIVSWLPRHHYRYSAPACPILWYFARVLD